MKTLIFGLVFFKCILIIQGLLSAGPIGKIKVYKLMECTKSNNVIVKWATKDNSNYKLDLFFNIPKEIDAKEKIKIVLDKWEGGKWQKGAYVYEYKFCELMFKVMKKTYNRAKVLSSPKLPNKCPIPQNAYTMNGFDFNVKDIGIPIIPYGRFYFTIKMVQLCLEGEADSIRK